MTYVQPGQVVVSLEACSLVTIVGSCVAVCVCDRARRIGGLNHYLLPGRVGDESARCGPGAIRRLLEEVVARGADRERLVAKVFGGALILGEGCRHDSNLGRENVRVALELLEKSGVPVVTEDVCGTRGRKLIFHSDTGDTWVRRL